MVRLEGNSFQTTNSSINKLLFGALFFIIISFSAKADIIDEEIEEGTGAVEKKGPVDTKKEQKTKTDTKTETVPTNEKDFGKLINTETKSEQNKMQGNKVQNPGESTKKQPEKKSNDEKKKSRKAEKENMKKEPVHFVGGGGAMMLKDQKMIELRKTPEKDLVITQADFRLEADKAKVFFVQNTDEVLRVEATGNVKIFKNDPETGKIVRAFGNQAIFYNEERKVVLNGNPRLLRGNEQQMRGKKITYQLDTGWVNVVEPEGVIQPEEKGGNPK